MRYLKAFQASKAPVESLYDSTFSVYGLKTVFDTDYGTTTHVPNQLLVQDEPCRITQKPRAGSTAVREGQDPKIVYEIKLLCDPLVVIPVGSRIIGKDIYGREREYIRADEGFNSYITHQEVTLIRSQDANVAEG